MNAICQDIDVTSSTVFQSLNRGSFSKLLRSLTRSVVKYSRGFLGFYYVHTCRRYKDDDALAKKMPVTVTDSSGVPSEGSGEDEQRIPRHRTKRLLRRDGSAPISDPVLSTLRVNRDLG